MIPLLGLPLFEPGIRRGRAAAVGAATLALGLALFVGVRGFVRGFAGDVLVVVFLDAVLATVGVGDARARVGGVLALGVLAEAIQSLRLVGPDAHWLLHLTIGSTADPVDLVAYGIGGLLAWPLERRVYRGAPWPA